MFMKRKGFSNVVVKVGARASALIALSLAIPMAVALSSCDREEPNCPKKTVKEPKGIEVLIDYEDVATGETTRSLSSGRSLGRLGEGFDVEADGLRLYTPKYKNGIAEPVEPQLTFYAKENVVFQGWSWRYGTDKPGTQRDSKGNIINDYIATPALQPDAGQHKLVLSADKTSFTCKYDPNSDNKVYVKVKYTSNVYQISSFHWLELESYGLQNIEEIRQVYNAIARESHGRYSEIREPFSKPGVSAIGPNGNKYRTVGVKMLHYLAQLYDEQAATMDYGISDILAELRRDRDSGFPRTGGIFVGTEYKSWSDVENLLEEVPYAIDKLRRDTGVLLYDVEDFIKKNPQVETCWYEDVYPTFY